MLQQGCRFESITFQKIRKVKYPARKNACEFLSCLDKELNLMNKDWSNISTQEVLFCPERLQQGMKFAGMLLTIDTKERLSGLTNTLPSVRVIASFPDISSKRTTPKAYTSLFVVAKPLLKYLLRATRINQ